MQFVILRIVIAIDGNRFGTTSRDFRQYFNGFTLQEVPSFKFLPVHSVMFGGFYSILILNAPKNLDKGSPITSLVIGKVFELLNGDDNTTAILTPCCSSH